MIPTYEQNLRRLLEEGGRRKRQHRALVAAWALASGALYAVATWWLSNG